MFPWFRWDAPLFFARAELFHERVLTNWRPPPGAVQWCVMAAEPPPSVDRGRHRGGAGWYFARSGRRAALCRVDRPRGRL